ncbi:hypothetical protein Pgy4_32801 [Pseudomonas savastanoi pv. glycinea str. race 4]|uniref:Uncharacterized protein n=1 Tax=Pseudomonas savastanoi pv. glycinea str. race 4 TaxID=875330 RepID=F3CEP6_PSESG|nr:hypothetical protein Pgy4_32801 [Pseudomonas savastanoi pv. glycinea str. race 4]
MALLCAGPLAFFVAAGQDSRQNTGESKQNESVPEHGNLNVQ